MANRSVLPLRIKMLKDTLYTLTVALAYKYERAESREKMILAHLRSDMIHITCSLSSRIVGLEDNMDIL